MIIINIILLMPYITFKIIYKFYDFFKILLLSVNFLKYINK
ncbi:protein of unknown function [Methanocaldococcus lauensis]|uniref:Uncharacterized protein n=1 Tax=Methanocaldococcus lauensis TaxID=2546128 RepID=A0A8D6PXJ4_9EURY|nr:protein of unknown function [Methanocaldococcus lauensis]